MTTKQAKALRAILAAGGKIRVHSGSVARRGGMHASMVRSLVRKGWAEESSMAPIPPAVVGARRTFATAAGCLALRAFELDCEARS